MGADSRGRAGGWARPVAALCAAMLMLGLPASDAGASAGSPPAVSATQGAPAAAPASLPTKQRSRKADVVVVGAGTSGIAAALSARREGARTVVLLDESDYLGGQVAAGVGTMDEAGPDRFDQRLEGIWRTVHSAMRAEYAARGWPHTSTCYGAAYGSSNICVSPSVARAAYDRLLRKAGVIVRLGVRTIPVVSEGRITGVRWGDLLGGSEWGLWSSPVVIDATEYGDLLAAAGAPYRSGNGQGNVAGRSPSGQIQDITWAAVVRKYPPGTMPAVLNLNGAPFPVPLGDPDPAGTALRVQAAFAARVAPQGSDQAGDPQPWGPLRHVRYRGLPDPAAPPYLGTEAARISRTALNFANDYPNKQAGDLGGTGMPAQYLEDPVFRREVNCQAKLRSIQFVWYMQNVLGQPDWSVADDEGFDTPYSRMSRCSGAVIDPGYGAFEAAMPVIPYVRESRRAIGVTTLTGAQILRQATGEPGSGAFGRTSLGAQLKQRRDTIAVGYYPMDIHGSIDDAHAELEFETSAAVTTWPTGQRPFGPYGIPLGSLVTKSVPGLILAEKNISQSRFANGATRLQSETTLVGAAAGTLAALAASSRVSPHQVPSWKVQHRLARRGQLPATNRFLDLSRSDPATAAFELAAVGDLDPQERHTSANPSGAVTKAEAATWIRRAVGLPSVPDVSAFADVPATAPYAADVEALRRAGLRVACGPGPSFCPDSVISRGGYMVWLATAMDARWRTAFTKVRKPTKGDFSDLPANRRSATINSFATHLRSAHGVRFASRFEPNAPLVRRDLALWTAWERFDPAFRR